MLTLSQVLSLNSHSIDFMPAYTQAPIDIKIYLQLPAGFDMEGGDRQQYFLRLKKKLYGLKQAGLSWLNTLHMYLNDQGFTQSKSDPCFFHHGKVILVCYVDDSSIFVSSKSLIDHLITDLKTNFYLTGEGDVDKYLGIKIEQLKDNEKKKH